MSTPLRWLAINQSQSPAFQAMLARLSDVCGRGMLLTGMPHPVSGSSLLIKRAAPYDRRSMARRLWSWLRFTASAVRVTWSVAGRPGFLVVTNPPITPVLIWGIARCLRRPFVLILWDLYPEHVVAAGLAGPRNWIVMFWRRVNRRVYRDAAQLVVLGERMAEVIRAYLPPSKHNRVVVIHNWADTTAIVPKDRGTNHWAIANGIDAAVVVQYAGNIGAAHELRGVLDAATALQDDDRFQFLFVGDGLGLAELKARATRLGLSDRRVKFLPRQKWEHLGEMLAAADVAIVSQRAGTEGLSVPSKTYSSLAAGCAILAVAAKHSDVSIVVEANEVGVVCAEGTGAEIAAALRGLADDSDALASMKRRARALAEGAFSEALALEQFRRVFTAGFAPVDHQ